MRGWRAGGRERTKEAARARARKKRDLFSGFRASLANALGPSLSFLPRLLLRPKTTWSWPPNSSSAPMIDPCSVRPTVASVHVPESVQIPVAGRLPGIELAKESGRKREVNVM